MEYALDASHEKYIAMIVTGVVEKESLIIAMSELLQHPEFLTKHSLWDLSNAELGLTIGDLKEITGILKLYKPKEEVFASRSAIVVPGQMHKAMVNLFITMTKRLPFKYNAFNDRYEAETFLCSE